MNKISDYLKQENCHMIKSWEFQETCLNLTTCFALDNNNKHTNMFKASHTPGVRDVCKPSGTYRFLEAVAYTWSRWKFTRIVHHQCYSLCLCALCQPHLVSFLNSVPTRPQNCCLLQYIELPLWETSAPPQRQSGIQFLRCINGTSLRKQVDLNLLTCAKCVRLMSLKNSELRQSID